MTPLIRAEGLTRVYPSGGESLKVLDDVSLTVAAGEFISIMGPSGCGKSTLLQVLGLLDRPDAGRYFLDGADTAALGEGELAGLRASRIGFVFQFYNLLPRATAQRNVELPLLYQGRAPQDRARAAAEALESVGLSARRTHRPGELSGGEQQRVALARALAAAPRLLLADEPTGNLSTAQTAEVLALFEAAHRAGLTILLVTHDPAVAARAPRRVVMRDGRIESDSGPVPAAAPCPAPRAAGRPGAWDRGRENAGSAAVSLRANWARTGLATLGVVVGTAAFLAMTALGSGARAQARERITALGANILLVLPDRGSGEGRESEPALLDLDDARAIAGLGPFGVVAVNPVASTPPTTLANGGTTVRAQVVGVSEAYPYVHDAPPAHGSFFGPESGEALEKVCVLADGAARALFGNPASAVGGTVKLRGLYFTVVGVLRPEGSAGAADLDQRVLVPVRTAMKRLTGLRTLSYIELRMTGPEREAAVREEVRALLRERHAVPDFRGDGFKLSSRTRIQEALSGVAKTLSTLLGSVAATALVVGGIGIMNIMLVSVRERTREIGLRKALGARRGDILLQFLIEAVLIGAAGGLAGLAVGFGAASAAGRLTGWRAVVEPGAAALAVLFAAATGAVSGLWPARQAADLPPAKALRYE